MKQLKLFSETSKSKTTLSFGGDLLNNKRKTRRHIDIKKPLHLVLKANLKTDVKTDLNNAIAKRPTIYGKQIEVNKTLESYSDRFKIKIYEKAFEKNHIHLLLKFNSRTDYYRFIRALTGQLAQKLNLKWLVRPFTRIVHWGRDFKRVTQYVFLNRIEAEGTVSYQRWRTRKPPS